MPNKTIYVSDDDLPLFQRAQELVGGNLSGTIVAALRRYIELEEGRAEGYEEVVLRLGHNGARQVRFSGRLLGDLQEMDGVRLEHFKVYRSRKGKFVLHLRRSDWKDYPTETNWIKDLTNWRKMLGVVPDEEWGEFTMDIYDNLTDLRGRIPDKLYARVADLADRPAVEDLDI
ncbi:EXLDI protein [Nocardia stercoris]|uniref:EXLDI protein n=1 Tax=Nocardia stercoris TaxID=2483361 RepID=A0A3M2LGU6_9NOCA|nr:EXLDI protein [Nocardia stercoris]RMI33978.1 EXLDI protein [Nocardia stercoris]